MILVFTFSKEKYLRDDAVEVSVAGTFNVKVTSADVVDGLIIDHEGTVRMLQSSVGGQDRVVGLDNSGGDLKFLLISVQL